jgi:hypothetical protein
MNNEAVLTYVGHMEWLENLKDFTAGVGNVVQSGESETSKAAIEMFKARALFSKIKSQVKYLHLF